MIWRDSCWHKDNIFITCIGEKVTREWPEILNKDYHCKLYKRKWWKIWVK
jgi:hypothetical protein